MHFSVAQIEQHGARRGKFEVCWLAGKITAQGVEEDLPRMLFIRADLTVHPVFLIASSFRHEAHNSQHRASTKGYFRRFV